MDLFGPCSRAEALPSRRLSEQAFDDLRRRLRARVHRFRVPPALSPLQGAPLPRESLCNRVQLQSVPP
jgi:hypothetical protein